MCLLIGKRTSASDNLPSFTVRNTNELIAAMVWCPRNSLKSNLLFLVDASKAGSGNLEINVTASGENVPNFVKSEGGGHYEVSYTPQLYENHTVQVRFNGALVPGSCDVTCLSLNSKRT